MRVRFILFPTLLARLLRQRQPHLKTRISGLGTNLNVAAVLFHDALHRVEAESRPLTYALGREKRLKNVRQDLRRNSGAVVADFHDHAIVLTIGAHAQLAFSSHRVDGIVDQVGPNLVEFAAEGMYKKR